MDITIDRPPVVHLNHVENHLSNKRFCGDQQKATLQPNSNASKR